MAELLVRGAGMSGGLARSIGVGLGRLLAVGAALACLGAAPWDAGASSIAKVRFGGDQNQTRIVIELNRSTEGRRLEDPNPLRLGLEMKGLDVPVDLGGEGQGLVRSWSVDAEGGSARLLVSLTRPASMTITLRVWIWGAETWVRPPASGLSGSIGAGPSPARSMT